jgi:hypothetical protein
VNEETDAERGHEFRGANWELKSGPIFWRSTHKDPCNNILVKVFRGSLRIFIRMI